MCSCVHRKYCWLVRWNYFHRFVGRLLWLFLMGGTLLCGQSMSSIVTLSLIHLVFFLLFLRFRHLSRNHSVIRGERFWFLVEVKVLFDFSRTKLWKFEQNFFGVWNGSSPSWFTVSWMSIVSSMVLRSGLANVLFKEFGSCLKLLLFVDLLSSFKVKSPDLYTKIESCTILEISEFLTCVW